MRHLRSIVEHLLSKEWYILASVTVLVLLSTPLVTLLNAVVVRGALCVWGGCVLVWDLFHRRDCLKTAGSILLAIFCLCGLVTTLLVETIWSGALPLSATWAFWRFFAIPHAGRREAKRSNGPRCCWWCWCC